VRAVRERPELELVGSATNGEEALAGLRRLEPDVAVLDVRMGGLGGKEILFAVKREGLATRVLLLSAYLADDLVYGALAAGAAGYLSKELDRDAILDAVAARRAVRWYSAPRSRLGLRAKSSDARGSPSRR
jgi:two-component system, NarL family, nitrate/nitrite response regulator NarL